MYFDRHTLGLFELLLYIPVNNFSIMSGCFIGSTSTKDVLVKDTTLCLQ